MKSVVVRLAVAAAIFLAVAAFWSSTRSFDFVNFDDGEYVTENDHVLGGLSAANVKWAWTTAGYAANWHPLTWMSLQMDVSLTGGDERLPGAMHLHNAILHALNAALLFLLAVMFLGKCDDEGERCPVADWWIFGMSALMAIAWAVHPLRAEAVAWVSERKEVLSSFFMLLTLIVYLKSAKSIALLGLSLVFYALALAAKPVAVSLPMVVLALDWLRGGRPRWWRFAAFSLLAAACTGLTLLAQQGAMPGTYIPFKWRVPNAFASIFTYFEQTFIPRNLAAYYPFRLSVDWLRMSGGLLLVAGGVWWACRSAVGRLALAWIGVGLLPMLGILQVGGQSHADRYTYWVGCGVALAVLAMLAKWREVCAGDGMYAMFRRRSLEWASIVVLAVLAAVYGVLGGWQRDTWRNTEAMFAQAYRATHSGWAANGLGDSCAMYDPVRAESLYREALAESRNDESLAKLACFLSAQPKIRDSAEIYALCDEAERLDAANWQIYEARGITLMREGRFAEAVPVLEKALARGSGNPMIAKMREDALRLSQK